MTDTLNGRVAANIRGELARRKMTHEQLAEATGMGRGAITAKLNEASSITLANLELIAEAFQVEPAKLLND